MQKTILSTADVARLFSVTETTVKRWADEGTLKCQKTPGGHRKFVIKYVIEFAEKNNLEPTGVLQMPEREENTSRLQMAILERNAAVLAGEFVERLLTTEDAELTDYLSYLYEHKIPLWQIYDEVTRALQGKHVIVEAVLVRDVILPEAIQTAIADKLAEEQRSQKMRFTLDKERQEAQRKQIEAEGILKYQNIVRQGLTAEYLQFKGIEATERLAASPNSKVVIVGGGKSGLPIILGGEK